MIRHLFVPGLLDPVGDLHQAAWPDLPHLERLLVRAERQREPFGYAGGLFALFGIDADPRADLPTAAVCWLAETGEAPTGCVMHADPLHLVADRDRVVAFDLHGDPPTDAERAALLEVFNGHFRDDGLVLQSSPAGRLYLHCDRPASLRSFPLSAVTGRDLDPFLPQGEDRRTWRGWLNEAQMVCHSLDGNRVREAGGRQTLDGLWFSGAGRLPPAGPGRVALLHGDEPLARGLMALHATAGDDEIMVEFGAARALLSVDPDAWMQALASVEARLAALQRDCDVLCLHPGNGAVWRWERRARWRLWRRRRRVSNYLGARDDIARWVNGV